MTNNLITRLESATAGNRALDAAVAVSLNISPTQEDHETYPPRYTTSLDAALPGEYIIRVVRSVRGNVWEAEMQRYDKFYRGVGRTEALARRIAALKAMVAE